MGTHKREGPRLRLQQRSGRSPVDRSRPCQRPQRRFRPPVSQRSSGSRRGGCRVSTLMPMTTAIFIKTLHLLLLPPVEGPAVVGVPEQRPRLLRLRLPLPLRRTAETMTTTALLCRRRRRRPQRRRSLGSSVEPLERRHRQAAEAEEARRLLLSAPSCCATSETLSPFATMITPTVTLLAGAEEEGGRRYRKQEEGTSGRRQMECRRHLSATTRRASVSLLTLVLVWAFYRPFGAARSASTEAPSSSLASPSPPLVPTPAVIGPATRRCASSALFCVAPSTLAAPTQRRNQPRRRLPRWPLLEVEERTGGNDSNPQQLQQPPPALHQRPTRRRCRGMPATAFKTASRAIN